MELTHEKIAKLAERVEALEAKVAALDKPAPKAKKTAKGDS